MIIKVKQLCILGLLLFTYTNSAGTINGKPNIWVYSDLVDPLDTRDDGHPKSDPDDIVSLASLLLSANRFHIESIVVGSGAHHNLQNPLPFIKRVFQPAYLDYIQNLHRRLTGFQEEISYQWSSITQTANPLLFDPNYHYRAITDLETVQSLVDYARHNKVYVLLWGSLTEPAILIKHLLATDQLEVLKNIFFISHWSASHVKSMWKEEIKTNPFKVSNCNSDYQACLYVHQQAKENPNIKMVELGSVGQTGIVDGSIGYENIEQFNDSRLGQIFISAKYNGNKADQSDTATHWFLSQGFGFNLSDYPHNGTLTKELEIENIHKFKQKSPLIMNDLLLRSKASSGAPYQRSFIAENFTYVFYRSKHYAIHSPYDMPYRITLNNGEVVATGQLNKGHNRLKLPVMPKNSYRVELVFEDKTVVKTI